MNPEPTGRPQHPPDRPPTDPIGDDEFFFQLGRVTGWLSSAENRAEFAQLIRENPARKADFKMLMHWLITVLQDSERPGPGDRHQT